MAKYGKQLERAITAAPTIKRGELSRTTSTDYFAQYKRKSDDHPITFNSSEPLSPSQVLVKPLDMEKLCREFMIVAGPRLIADPSKRELINEESLEETFRHEARHIKAAYMLGAETVRFGIQVVNYALEYTKGLTFRPFTRPANFKTTKLALACMAIAPDTPSLGDLEIVKALGYANPREVRAKARAEDLRF